MNKKILTSPEPGNRKDFLDPDTLFIKMFSGKNIKDNFIITVFQDPKLLIGF